MLARAVWWGQADSTHPLTLDCLLTDDAVADRAGPASELLAAAHRVFLDGAAPQLPDDNVLKLPGDWRSVLAAAAAAVAWRQEAAARAGLTVTTERL